MIDVIFAVYKRWERIDKIMEQLRNQTIDNFRVSIWNNSGRELKITFPTNRLQIINSEKNIGSGDRWKLIKYTTGNPIICFDDDEDLDKDFVEYHYKEYLKWGDKYILGWYTKLLNPIEYRNELVIKLPYGTEVDYLGGGGSVRGRSLFEIEPKLIDDDFYRKFVHADDLWHSYLAWENEYKLISIEPRCKMILDGNDMNKRYKISKNNAYLELRKMGWKLLCESTILDVGKNQ